MLYLVFNSVMNFFRKGITIFLICQKFRVKRKTVHKDLKHFELLTAVTFNIEDLQFKYEDHFILILEGVVEVDQLAVVEMVHDVDLFSDQSLLHRVPDRNKLGSKYMLSLQFATSVYDSEGSSADLF